MGRKELIETDAGLEGTVRSIENSNLSEDAKAEALRHLEKRHGTL